MNPKISVIMGIYNCADTLEDAVKSIQNQTYGNWELILCDDGSLDKTYEVAQKLKEKDPRIILLKNKKNMGLNQTLNNCLDVAKGEYIARMDGDDTCLPNRFELQTEFLDSHNDFDITSSPMVMFDENGDWGETTLPEYPTPEQVVVGSPIAHAPVMLRKKSIDAVNGYTVDKKMLRVEDVNLWIKLYANGSRCYNIQKPLYKMRNDKNAFSRRKYIYRINSVYVRLQGCKMLNLPVKCYLKALSPMIIGLIPARLRKLIRKIVKGM